MYIRRASSPSTVLWAFHTIQPSSLTMETHACFWYFHVLAGSAEALVRWGGKIKHLLIFDFLNNMFAKNYQNWFVCAKVIARWRWDYFGTQCISTYTVRVLNAFPISEISFGITFTCTYVRIKILSAVTVIGLSFLGTANVLQTS